MKSSEPPNLESHADHTHSCHHPGAVGRTARPEADSNRRHPETRRSHSSVEEIVRVPTSQKSGGSSRGCDSSSTLCRRRRRRRGGGGGGIGRGRQNGARVALWHFHDASLGA